MVEVGTQALMAKPQINAQLSPGFRPTSPVITAPTQPAATSTGTKVAVATGAAVGVSILTVAIISATTGWTITHVLDHAWDKLKKL